MNETIEQLTLSVNGTHMMRNGALENLTDADLTFSPGGDSPTLGELFKALGDLQHSYTESLRTKQHDWSHKAEQADLATSIGTLTTWFAQLDSAMMMTLEQITDADMAASVDRTGGVTRTVKRQIGIYLEAMLIFLGKLVVYFQALQKPIPNSIQHYIV